MPTKSSEFGGNGESSSAEKHTPEVVDISRLRTGDLIEAWWFGMRSREMLKEQIEFARQYGERDANLALDMTFIAQFKEAQERLAAAIDGCNKIKAELNARYATMDAMRWAMLDGEIQKE